MTMPWEKDSDPPIAVGRTVRVVPSDTAPDYAGLTGTVTSVASGKNLAGFTIHQHRVSCERTPENMRILRQRIWKSWNPESEDLEFWFVRWELEEI